MPVVASKHARPGRRWARARPVADAPQSWSIPMRGLPAREEGRPGSTLTPAPGPRPRHPGGGFGSIGAAGLTLGGGIGHLPAPHRSTCDNLPAATIVASLRTPKAARRRTSSTTWAGGSAPASTTAPTSWWEPGDITSLPSGHDPWVVLDGHVVVVDWYGASSYAKPAWRRMWSSGNGRPSSSSGDRPTTVNPSAS
jgi:hypothetical protein